MRRELKDDCYNKLNGKYENGKLSKENEIAFEENFISKKRNPTPVNLQVYADVLGENSWKDILKGHS